MASIFLSYAREDRTCAEALARVLEGAGHSVWWDRHIGGGSEFAGEIEAALNAADVVLAAWSKDSVKSRWVRDEASSGADSGKLLPLSIDGSLPPMGFRQFHTLDLTGWRGAKKDSRTAELFDAVERKVKGAAGAGPSLRAAPKRWVALPMGRSLWAIAAVFVLIAAVGAALMFQNFRSTQNAPLKPTIALLPFTTASPDPELRTLASQARDSIAHTFSQSGVPLRLLDAAPQDGRPTVDFLISGDVSRSGDKVLATVRLDEAAHSVTVYSHRFEAGREDVRDLPERIGAQMAGNLTWSWPLLVLDRRHPLDPALMADILQSDFTTGDPLQAYQYAKRVIAKAPNFQVSQVHLAYSTAFALDQLPRDERPEAVAEARRATDRGVALGPNFGDAYTPWCILRSETLGAECEDRLRIARRADPDAPFVNTFLSHRLRGVGRFDESADLARLAHTHDVYVPTKIAWMLKTLEYSGEGDAARELNQQGARWWPEYRDMFFRNRMYGLLERGDFEAIAQLEQEVGVAKLMPRYRDSSALVSALKSKSIAGARQACPASGGELLKIRCMLVLSSLGDQDSAYAIADKLYPRRMGRTPAETERIWLDAPDGAGGVEFVTSPVAAPMRRDPRYFQLAERTGLLAYWRSGRPPDFCRKDPEPICGRLLRRTN